MVQLSVEQLTEALTASLAAQRQGGEAPARIPTGFTPEPPATFSGSDRTRLRLFKLEVTYWLTFFPDVQESTRAAMVGSRLKDLAKEAFLRLVERSPAGELTVASVLEHLDRSFSDPNELQRTLACWEELKQGPS